MLELKQAEIAIVRDLLKRRLPGHEVRAFGSRTTGRAKRYSDLDLVVMTDTVLPERELSELRADLEESDLPFRVDIVAWGELPEAIRTQIVQNSALLQASEGPINSQ